MFGASWEEMLKFTCELNVKEIGNNVVNLSKINSSFNNTIQEQNILFMA